MIRAPSLPGRSRLRQAWRGVGEGRPSTTPVVDRTPDLEVLELITDPYVSVEDAETRLVALERLFRARGDRRAVFLSVYSRVTAAVGAGCARDDFADPEWVAAYLVAFADLYRQALLDYETGNLAALADPWQLAFEAAERGDALVVQDCALGINAHINYDLALALHDVGIDPDRESKYRDHLAVNDVLRRLVDETQDTLADRFAPGIAAADEAMGRLDEILSHFAITEGRDSAWRTAVALADSKTGLRARWAMWVTRVTSTGAAYLILSPGAVSPVHDSLRAAERDPGRHW